MLFRIFRLAATSKTDVPAPTSSEGWKRCSILLVIGLLSTVFAASTDLYQGRELAHKTLFEILLKRISEVNDVQMFPGAGLFFYSSMLYTAFNSPDTCALFECNAPPDQSNTQKKVTRSRVQRRTPWMLVAAWSIIGHTLLQKFAGTGMTLSLKSMATWGPMQWSSVISAAVPAAFVLVPGVKQFLTDVKGGDNAAMGLASAVAVMASVAFKFVDEPVHIHHWALGWYITMMLAPLHKRLLRELASEEAPPGESIPDIFRSPKRLQLLMVEIFRIVGIGMCSHGFWVWGPASKALVLSNLAVCGALAIYRDRSTCQTAARRLVTLARNIARKVGDKVESLASKFGLRSRVEHTMNRKVHVKSVPQADVFEDQCLTRMYLGVLKKLHEGDSRVWAEYHNTLRQQSSIHDKAE